MHIKGAKAILILTFFSAICLVGLFHLPTGVCSHDVMGPFTVTKVVDGDTVVLNDGRHLRYLGINTPERGEPLWKEARDYNARAVKGKQVMVGFEPVTQDKYGRTLVYLFIGGEMINAELLKAGLAHLYVLQPISHYHSFRNLQEEARSKGLGIWGRMGVHGPLKITRLNANAEGDDRYNLNGEYVRVCNISPAEINLAGFTISDFKGYTYTFPQAILRPGYTALLFSGEGQDVVQGADQLYLYWGSRYPIWNNDGDSATLKDPQGRPIDSVVHKGRRYQ